MSGSSPRFLRASILAATMATMVEQVVAMREGIKMAAGLVAPAAARMVITPRGSRVTLEVLIAKNRHMALVAVPFSALSFSNSCMALIPMGVAALPRPRALAAMFMIMA